MRIAAESEYYLRLKAAQRDGSSSMDASIFGEVTGYFLQNKLEAIGALSGLLCVWLLMRENVLNFPIGAIYAVVSVVVFYDARLYGQVLLHIYFVVVNLFGLYHWLYGMQADESKLPVSRTSAREWLSSVLAAVIGVVVLATLFDQFTDAALPFVDFALTAASVVAMWLSARKKLESWVLWFIIDVGYAGLFLYTQNYFYLILYVVYIPMAVAGFRLWSSSMRGDADAVAAAKA